MWFDWALPVVGVLIVITIVVKKLRWVWLFLLGDWAGLAVLFIFLFCMHPFFINYWQKPVFDYFTRDHSVYLLNVRVAEKEWKTPILYSKEQPEIVKMSERRFFLIKHQQIKDKKRRFAETYIEIPGKVESIEELMHHRPGCLIAYGRVHGFHETTRFQVANLILTGQNKMFVRLFCSEKMLPATLSKSEITRVL